MDSAADCDNSAAQEREEHRFSVPDMDCPSCAGKVTNSIEKLDGILELDASPTTGQVIVEYDTGRLSPATIRQQIGAAGYSVESRNETTTLSVPEMDCPSCAKKIKTAFAGIDEVTQVETQPTTGQVTITHTVAVDTDELIATISTAGYDATLIGEGRNFGARQQIWRTPRGITTFIGALLVTVGMFLQFVVPASDPFLFELASRTFNVSHVLFILSAALAGAPILRNGYYSARNWSLDIDFLMSAGIIGSVGTHHPFEGAMLAVLFSIAQLLERYSMDRARGSLRELMELSPDVATVRRNGDEESVPVKALDVGETVIVRPGEKIPVDGVVTEGTSAVNQAPITGESVPVNKSNGDDVYAGTINEEGYLEIEVTSTSTESTIARIIQLVEDAQREKTEREQFVDRLASVYTPVVVSAAVLVMILPPVGFGASWNTWFLRGLTLLVIACPCAFVISTPVSVVSGITSAAKNGVLIKSGRDLEAVGDTGVLAMDKTGTVTTGELTVTDTTPVDGIDESELLRRATLIERRSEHPIAKAIVEHTEHVGVTDEETAVKEFEAITGKGVSAELNGRKHFVGKPELFRELGFALERSNRLPDGGETVTASEPGSRNTIQPKEIGDMIHDFERDGKSIVLVGTERKLLGVIAISDEPRQEAKWAISKLQEQDIRVVMLTGDNEGTARAVAESVGIDEYHANLLPEEKLDRISDLKTEYGYVAMVGDGINDAPAMASSTVGIAMGAAGTDTALETADIALMGDDLTRLPYLYRLSQKSNGVIRQNIWSSLGVKAILALGAPFGIVTVIHAVVIGDMGMSLAVTGNAMRLSEVQPEKPDTGEQEGLERTDE